MTEQKDKKNKEEKKEIILENKKIKVICDCGAEFEVLSTMKEMKIEICSQCHPFYTGQAKTVDTAGRVEKFKKRFAAKK